MNMVIAHMNFAGRLCKGTENLTKCLRYWRLNYCRVQKDIE